MSQRRVLVVGDSPWLKTGFAQVNRQAIQAFQSKGWKIAALTCLDQSPPTQDAIQVFLPSNPTYADMADVKAAVTAYEPDLIYHTGEFGTAVGFGYALEDTEFKAPYLTYLLQEGDPIVNQHWLWYARTNRIITATEGGAEAIKTYSGAEVPWVYHGIDHDAFNTQKRDDGTAAAIRAKYGWQNKFIMMYVATNVRRKQWPRLIEALGLLKYKYNQTNMMLYAHTVPFNHHYLNGWNLPELNNQYGVLDEVVFHPDLVNKTYGAGVNEGEDRQFPTLSEMYAVADLLVHPSQVEGFGLPIAEAMASGLPVLTTRYAAGWEVGSPAAAPLPVHDWETHQSGTKYANVDPHDIAKEVLRLRRDPKRLQRMSEAGVERAKDFTWDRFRELVVEHGEQAVQEEAQKRAS
jgi:glycosyltransferase involved in cell wall biosynthesis